MKVKPDQLKTTLPKCGERLSRVMTGEPLTQFILPEDCVVTYVNQLHHWYQVKFIATGILECYNFPVFDHALVKGAAYKNVPCLCLETGKVYPSVKACAADMGLDRSIITRIVNKDYGPETYYGYHFARIF